jgi:SAM-dependent methyltransferase
MADVALPLGKFADPENYELLKIARLRLYPGLTDPNFLVLRARRIIFQNWIADITGTELKILDVGGRYQPYRPLVQSRAGQYVACDISRTDLVNVVGDGESLPFAHESFDVVIATQVFDCFTDPQEAARQVHRVLKPGGVLLASIPAMAPRFSDAERWRFTSTGVRSIFSAFSELKIVPELSSIGGMLRLCNLALESFAPSRIAKAVMHGTLIPGINLIGLGLEALRVTSNDQFSPNYSVMAAK